MNPSRNPTIETPCRFRRFFLVLSALLASLAHPDPGFGQWSIYGDEEQLRGKAVAEVGELTLQSELRNRYDPFLEMEVLETVEWLNFQGRERYCFPSDALGVSVDREAALLLVDNSRQLFLATIQSYVGSIRVEVEPASQIACPGSVPVPLPSLDGDREKTGIGTSIVGGPRKPQCERGKRTWRPTA